MKALIVVIVLLLIPIPRLNCPDWNVEVVDGDGKPVKGARVDLSYQNLGAEYVPTFVHKYTDDSGRVSFEHNRIYAPLAQYAYVILFGPRAIGDASLKCTATLSATLEEKGMDTEKRIWTGSPSQMQTQLKLVKVR